MAVAAELQPLLGGMDAVLILETSGPTYHLLAEVGSCAFGLSEQGTSIVTIKEGSTGKFSSEKYKRQHGKLLPRVSLIFGLTTLAGLFIWGGVFTNTTPTVPFQSPRSPQTKGNHVQGNLGGLFVSMPRKYVEFVEYDNDPSFGEKYSDTRREPTSNSRIRAFGIESSFPSIKHWADGTANLSHNTEKKEPRLYVGISAGEDYPGKGFLDRIAGTLEGNVLHQGAGEHKGSWPYTYLRQQEKQHDLEVFLLYKTDPRTQKPARLSEDTYDIFIHRLPSGEVDTYIECRRTYVLGGVATCGMNSSLAPKAEVQVRVSFARNLLPKWREIQRAAHGLLLSFEVKEKDSKSVTGVR